MMRALWTAASGMINQQANVDTISNNLANVDTKGFKRESAEFKSLLYQTLQAPSGTEASQNKPVLNQVGLGVRTASIVSNFEQGDLLESTSNYDFALEGEGFFKVRAEDGSIKYTRNGSFQVSVTPNGNMINTTEGLPILDSNNQPIVIPFDYQLSSIVVDEDGTITATNKSGNQSPLGIKFGLVQFSNPAGLEKGSNSLLMETAASGTPIDENVGGGVVKSKVHQKYLEGSNVHVVQEMVKMIVSQRAYEMNSKAIQAADTMLQQANNLRG